MSDYTPLDEYGVQANGSAIQTCGPHTGHSVKNIAFCDSAETAAWLVRKAGGRVGLAEGALPAGLTMADLGG